MIRIKVPELYLFIDERFAGLPFLEALAQAQPAKWSYAEGEESYTTSEAGLEVFLKAKPPKHLALEVSGAPPGAPPSSHLPNIYYCPTDGEVEITKEEFEKQTVSSTPWYCPKCLTTSGSVGTGRRSTATVDDDDIPF